MTLLKMRARRILAKLQGSRYVEFFWDTFSKPRFLICEHCNERKLGTTVELSLSVPTESNSVIPPDMLRAQRISEPRYLTHDLT